MSFLCYCVEHIKLARRLSEVVEEGGRIVKQLNTSVKTRLHERETLTL
jgi:hypothetical protein